MSPSSTLVHVIDDDEAIRASLAFLLETAGLSCRTWAS
ncbi:MAG: DNA-binding response regulator, partial [Phenylobacterium sp.]|nr:DNA-binding response regulator [Phenylobacterium sp.]